MEKGAYCGFCLVLRESFFIITLDSVWLASTKCTRMEWQTAESETSRSPTDCPGYHSGELTTPDCIGCTRNACILKTV